MARKRYRKPKIRSGEREHLVAAIITYLLRPGLIEASEIFLNQMILQKDPKLASSLLELAKDMALRGFPTREERDAATELNEMLNRVGPKMRQAVEDDDEDTDRKTGRGQPAGPDAGAEAPDLGTDNPQQLP